MIGSSLRGTGCVRLRVIVVGGGIGGAASAIALRQLGFDPLVLERAAVSAEVGAGLGLAANAMKVLDHLGVGDRVRTTGVVAENIEWRGLDDDEEIFVQRTQAMAARYGHEYHCAHRADLLDTLVSALPSERLRLGSPVVAVRDSRSEAVVELQSGEELTCDLVIGADGLRSTIRTCLFGDEPARFTGFVVWRAIVPAEVVPERFARKITTWLGVGRHSMLYPVRADAFNLSGFMPAAEVHGESWTNPANIADLRRVFAGTNPEFTGLFDSIARGLITPLYFRDPLERWSSGRVASTRRRRTPDAAERGAGCREWRWKTLSPSPRACAVRAATTPRKHSRTITSVVVCGPAGCSLRRASTWPSSTRATPSECVLATRGCGHCSGSTQPVTAPSAGSTATMRSPRRRPRPARRPLATR